jgi:hypothetical protein
VKRAKLAFSEADYDAAVARYRAEWSILDDALYKLCRENPRHNSSASVYAKVFIIGRSYATGIERQVKSLGGQGSSISQVASCFMENGKSIDKLLDRISEVNAELTPSLLDSVINVHGGILNFLRPITRKLRSPRSFVSKYLHFHNPLTPIYDSYSAWSLERLVPDSETIRFPVTAAQADEQYAQHVARFLSLYSRVSQKRSDLTVKNLDHYLVWRADEEAVPLQP